MQKLISRLQGLYAICDPIFSPQYSAVELARLLLKGGARLLQVRLKNASAFEVKRVVQSVLEEKKNHSFLLIVNDHVEIAQALPVDGVHLGENDLPIAEARKRLGPNKLIGYSSHSIEEAKQAQMLGADYIAFGAIFPTKTKGPGHPVQGLDKLKQFVSAIQVPTVAIGGIDSHNVNSVLETGVSMVAMITALTQAPNVTHATQIMLQHIVANKD